MLKSSIPKEIPFGNEVITKSNFRSFSRDQITDSLIINFAGKKKKRRKSFNKLSKKNF